MQNKLCQTLAKELMSKYSFINQVCREFVMDYWPDNPPWTSLFGKIGFSICENWSSLNVEEKSNFFEIIELPMYEQDDYLKTAITTGLIEAIVHFTDNDKNLWAEIESYMFPATKEFAYAYKNAVF